MMFLLGTDVLSNIPDICQGTCKGTISVRPTIKIRKVSAVLHPDGSTYLNNPYKIG